MYYVLNFREHTFMSSSAMDKAMRIAEDMVGIGIQADEVEIVNADDDYARFSVDGFRHYIKKYGFDGGNSHDL